MSDQLLDIAMRFKTSKPVFALELNEEGTGINARTVERYVPSYDENDLIEAVVAENYHESFSMSKGRYETDPHSVAQRAMGDIKDLIGSFIGKNHPGKKDQRNKLWRWFKNNNGSQDIMIMMYKYIRTFASIEGYANKSDPHTANAIALLTAIMEKHDN